MPRIPAALIESIKRDVSCVSVLEGRGSVFQPHGGDVVCRCPFHDDRSPSLVVSVGKNLWRCHGACGMGGDVIALIQKLNGMSFRHAVELAAAGVPVLAASFAAEMAGGENDSSGGSGASRPPKVSSARLLPCPLDSAADDVGLMQQVVDYYAGRLVVPGNAGRAYVAGRGLDDAELMRRFSLGFADRSLGLRLPNKQRKEGAELRGRLEQLGLFRASGHEHFAGSVVVPIHGDDGSVVGMYGRKVTAGLRSGTPLHTYLPGKHRGIWNAGPGLVNGDGAVVVCEALIDAMSFWVSGVRHVTAAYGVNGFTDAHWSALRAGRARDVFIAFDADAAGDAAAARVAEEAIARGLTVFRVVFPPDRDANAVVTAADGGRDALASLITSAVWMGGAPRVAMHGPSAAVHQAVAVSEAAKEESALAVAADGDAKTTVFSAVPSSFAVDVAAAAVSFAAAVPSSSSSSSSANPIFPAGAVVRRDGVDVFIAIGSRSYRVRGWQARKAADTLTVALRVAVATAQGERVHHDRVDLYQVRQRSAFVAAAAEECGLFVDVVKADVGVVMAVVEAVQAEVAAESAEKSAVSASCDAAAMSAADRAAALELLNDPDVCGRIVRDVTRCGLVGEDVNKLVAYLAASSRKLESPLAVVVQSSSAAGKSTLMDRVLAFMPPEDVRQYSAISGKSPFYLGTANLKHRILAIAEEEGARRASYALKLLQSDGFLAMAATGKDPESGKLVTHDYRVEGPVMLMLTTTAIDVDPELLNRCLVLTVDEDAAQTAAIQQAQREGRTLAGLAAKRERAAVVALHQNAQRLLRSLTVVNPFAPSLTFAAGQTRLRRDHAKYLALIDAVALVHQYQRPVKTHRFDDGTMFDYIEVEPSDIVLANKLAAVVLARSLDELPPQTRRFLLSLHAWAVAAAQAAGVTLERLSFTRREAREGLGVGQTQAALHLDRLLAHEFVVVLRPVGDGLVTRYRLVWTPHVADANGLGLACASVVTPPSAQEPARESIGMTSTCRENEKPIGVVSGMTPTGENAVNTDILGVEMATYRDVRAHIRDGQETDSIIIADGNAVQAGASAAQAV